MLNIVLVVLGACIEFAPSNTSSLIISLKSNISEHPPLFLNDYHISEVNYNSSDHDVLLILLLHGTIILRSC